MDERVSFDNELLILVDQNDLEIGNLSKDHCHIGEGKMHRAFSIFVINSKGQILLQQRSEQKKLWPDFWSNSCCSHPRKGESTLEAAHRRLEQELGIQADLKSLYKFEYRAKYLDIGAEHELCSVLVGHSDDTLSVNKNEINDCCWLSPSEIDELLAKQESLITPWFRMEWDTLTAQYSDEIQNKQ